MQESGIFTKIKTTVLIGGLNSALTYASRITILSFPRKAFCHD